MADIANPDFEVVGPGLVLTSPVFVRSSASHPATPHGRLAKKTVYREPIAGGREGSTQFAQQFVTAVTDPPLVGCVVLSLLNPFISHIASSNVHCRQCATLN